jgi:hypothetical protein
MTISVSSTSGRGPQIPAVRHGRDWGGASSALLPVGLEALARDADGRTGVIPTEEGLRDVDRPRLPAIGPRSRQRGPRSTPPVGPARDQVMPATDEPRDGAADVHDSAEMAFGPTQPTLRVSGCRLCGVPLRVPGSRGALPRYCPTHRRGHRGRVGDPGRAHACPKRRPR